MTYQAREVLSDCRIALQLLEEEQDFRRWRVHWAAAMALIRAVGHVLDKVDGRNPDIKKAAKQTYKEWTGSAPEHAIFRDFIENGRNSLLKEYEMNVHPLEDVPVALEAVVRSGDEESVSVARDVFELGENIYRPMMDGPWEGEDAREVLSEAIDWWERQLDLIDEMIHKGHEAPRRR